MDKYCTKCGQKLAAEARFCIKCGAEQRVMPETPKHRKVLQQRDPAAKIFEKKDAESNKVDVIGSYKSGSPQYGVENSTEAKSQKRNPFNKTLPFAAGCILLLCVLIAIFGSSGNSNTPKGSKNYNKFVSKMEELQASAKDNYFCIKEQTETYGTYPTVSETIYLYDEQCNLIQKSHSNKPKDFDPNGLETAQEQIYTYNNSGNLIEETFEIHTYQYSSGVRYHHIDTTTTTYAYDHNNHIIEARYTETDSGGKQSSGYNEYIYYDSNPGEHMITSDQGWRKYYNADGTLSWEENWMGTTECKYFENGNLKSVSTRSASSNGKEIFYSTEYTYEWDISSGKQIVYDSHTNPDLNGKTECEYDQYGNCIKKTRYNADGTLDSITEYTYWDKDMIQANGYVDDAEDGFPSEKETASSGNGITIENFESKVDLKKGKASATDSLLRSMNDEAVESGSPYTFKFKFLGTHSGQYYLHYGEQDVYFNVYRITYSDGSLDYYFVPINSAEDENSVYSLQDNYYELVYRYTKY